MSALRAQFPVYGLILRYFLWMNTFSRKYQQMIIYGASVASRVLGAIGKEYPFLAPLIGFVLILWRIFSYLTWTIQAGTTLLLRFNKYGRELVSRKEILESNIVGVLWLGALGCWLYHLFVDPFTLFCRVGIPVFLTLPLVVGGGFGSADYGWPMYLARGILAIMGVSSLLGVILFTFSVPLGKTLLLFYFNSLSPVLMILAYLDAAEPERS